MGDHVTHKTCRLLKGLVVGFLLSLSLLNLKTCVRMLYDFTTQKGRIENINLIFNTQSNIYVALLTSEKTWSQAVEINNTWGSQVDQIEFFSRNVPSLPKYVEYRLITGIPETGDSPVVNLIRTLQDVCYRVAGSFRWYFISPDDTYINVARIRQYLAAEDHNDKIVASQLTSEGHCSDLGLLVFSDGLLREMCRDPTTCFQGNKDAIQCLKTTYQVRCLKSVSAGFQTLQSRPNTVWTNTWVIHPVVSVNSMSSIHSVILRQSATSVITKVASYTPRHGTPPFNKALLPSSQWKLLLGRHSFQYMSQCLPNETLTSLETIILHQMQRVFEIYADYYTHHLISASRWSVLGIYWNQSATRISLIADMKSSLSQPAESFFAQIHADRSLEIKHQKFKCPKRYFWIVVYVSQPEEICGKFEKVWSQFKEIYEETELLVLTPYMVDLSKIISSCLGKWLHELGPKSNDVAFAETREVFVKQANLESLAHSFLKARYKKQESVSMLLMSELYLDKPQNLARCYMLAACGKHDLFNMLLSTTPGGGSSTITGKLGISCIQHYF